jgi:hypothetical protein
MVDPSTNDSIATLVSFLALTVRRQPSITVCVGGGSGIGSGRVDDMVDVYFSSSEPVLLTTLFFFCVFDSYDDDDVDDVNVCVG